jgi:FSR family fosmidomycin resistance protein-like MFS transporter
VRKEFPIHPTVTRLASAHFVSDAYSNMYAPLLPALIPKLGLSLAGAGTLAMLFQLAASVSQPLFGHLADRWKPRVLILAGPLVSVVVLSLIGVAWSAPVLAAVLLVGGLGGSAFHPSAAAVVHRIGGERRGLAMAWHITGGSVGYSLGPLVFAAFVGRFGLDWTPILAVPGLVMLWYVLKRIPPVEPFSRGRAGGLAGLRPHAFPLFLLWAIVVLRTLASLSIATFVPVLLTRQGWSVAAAGAAVSAYLFTSSVGGFLGGPLSDRFGPRFVIALSMLGAAPFLAIAPHLEGWGFVAVLSISGLFLQSTLPVNVTFAHAIAPASAATVSSLMMGFAWGTGGLAVPLVGMLADRIGIQEALMTLALLPLAGALCVWPLPRTPDAATPAVVTAEGSR